MLLIRVLNFYQDLLSPSVLNLWKMNVQHTVAKVCGGIAQAERPAQMHDASKLPEASFRTKVGKNFSTVWASFLFTPDAELGATQADLDLVGSDSGKLRAD